MKKETKRKIGLADTGKVHKKVRRKTLKCLRSRNFAGTNPCFEEDCLCFLHYVSKKEWYKQIIRVFEKRVFK